MYLIEINNLTFKMFKKIYECEYLNGIIIILSYVKTKFIFISSIQKIMTCLYINRLQKSNFKNIY